MKHTAKTYLVLSLVVMVAASCRPLTPVATATKLTIPSALPTVTSTPFVLHLSPSDGLEKGVSSYRLRRWNEDNYAQIVESLNRLVDDEQNQIPYFMKPDYQVVFQLEHLLRYPDSSDRDDVLWDILIEDPRTMTIPGTQIAGDLMSSLISDLLAQNIQPLDLPSELEKHGVLVISTLTVQNMTGNGENGLVLLIKLPNDLRLTGAFVVFRNDGKFRVQKVHDWEVSEGFALYRDFKLQAVGDTNGNSLPEVVVQIEAGGGGIAKENIDHIEWSPQTETFQSVSLPVFWQDCDELGTGPCEGDWEFSTVDSQDILLTKSYWFTRKDCGDITVQRAFIWNGTEYILGNIEIVPPGDSSTPECHLAWAETAIWIPGSMWDGRITEPGWKNDLVISITEQSLKSWPAQADEIWGPAGRDYFKLRLGVWYDLRNEIERAQASLQQVANRPSQANYDFVSRLAALYLDERATFGRVRACLALENTYFEELHTAIPDPSPYNNDKATLKAWGIVEGKGSLCDVYEMLPVDVKSAQLRSPDTLMQWLDKTELTIYQKTSIDLNDDGLEDYLILLDTTDSETPDAWAFLATLEGYQASYIGEIPLKDEQSELEIRSMEIEGSAPVQIVLSAEGDLNIFRVTPGLGIETLMEDYDVQSIDADDVRKSVTVQINRDDEPHKTITYLWNPDSQAFVEQPDDFAHVETEIEKLFYSDRDYQAAINYIDDFLRTAPPEPKQAYACGVDIPDGCLYSPEWYGPNFRYLRGLAYEQLGQNEQAKQAYFELWRDFPGNVFGMAASLKLEPVRP
ncbi:MAG TPA: hypothetical protein VLE49_00500 [Anaerolineales bacterium]|nr:hypothetical protein [Anaerolineales bacterium]